MNKSRSRHHMMIDGAYISIEQVVGINPKGCYKLLSTSKVGKYSVVCKYREDNERYNRNGKMYYTPKRMTLSVQIMEGRNTIYQINAFNRNQSNNSINIVNNNEPTIILNDSDEYKKFTNLLDEILPKLDNFTKDFVDLTLEANKTQDLITSTPKCVGDIINAMDKQQLDLA